MLRGPKPKAAHLKLVEGTYRTDRSATQDGAPVTAPERPKHIKGRAAKIWAEMLAKHPSLTQFQITVLGMYCALAAEHEEDATHMPTARIVEMRRQAEVLQAPRVKGDDGNKAKDPAAKYLD